MFFDSLLDLLKNKEDSTTFQERELGQWYYDLIDRNIYIEKSGAFFERVQSIAKRLNQVRGAESIEPVIIWIPQVIAFIMPGNYLYISRELLQRLKDDEAVAFIFAHEMSHYDLGHTRLYHSYLSTLKQIPGGDTLALLFLNAKLMAFSQERERQADESALNLCSSAGYDGYRCLKLFDVLEAYYLDFRYFDGVFGSEENSSNDLVCQWLNPLLKQVKHHTTSHPDLHSRKQYLLEHLSK